MKSVKRDSNYLYISYRVQKFLRVNTFCLILTYIFLKVYRPLSNINIPKLDMNYKTFNTIYMSIKQFLRFLDLQVSQRSLLNQFSTKQTNKQTKNSPKQQLAINFINILLQHAINLSFLLHRQLYNCLSKSCFRIKKRKTIFGENKSWINKMIL